ncbi:hypothetical protein GCM10022247_45470 [Allokutzneria multivorans]|uniref:M23ase beta-sheet core domain-containing protein n=1 Tax=Allokutzneria multivorans TaxID=1142134 RepID=A0ABP7SVP7_9PSEU
MKARVVTLLFGLIAALFVAPAAQASPDARPVFQMPFGCDQIWRAYTHTGHAFPNAQIDMGQPPSAGKIVRASYAGRVTGSGIYNDGVSFVIIDHGGGWSTRYLHMQRGSLIKAGTTVARGAKVGLVGDVGSPGQFHLHYEQRLNARPVPILWNNSAIRYVNFPNYLTYRSRNC